MKNFTIRILFFFYFLLLISTTAKAQVDTEFWFVAPELTKDHGEKPVSFRITAFEQDAEVKVSMPAINKDSTFTVPANTQLQYEGLNNVALIENKPPATRLDKGILITSDVDISVYYDAAPSNNPDKFTLKGENALGTEFFIPSQNAYKNQTHKSVKVKDENGKEKRVKIPYEDPAREAIDIVATEDDTEIVIELTDDVYKYDENNNEIIAHEKGDTISIVLNRGQTYSLVATKAGEQAARHLGGTHITSNKPIAVTISDDSVMSDKSGHWDLIGDQLIPVDMLGTEYIAMHTLYGHDIETDQKVFVLAVENDTYLFVDGEANDTLVSGELRELNITNNAIYITSDKPVYAYQVTGIPPKNKSDKTGQSELGSAILPHSKCTGSTSVSFTRVLTYRFYVQLITKGRDRNNFVMKDSIGGTVTNTFLKDIKWNKVPGTGTGIENDPDAWYSAVIQMGWEDSGTNAEISTGNPYTISNSGLFHMSILDENNVSMSFGYFSDYSTLRVSGPTMTCEGSTATLKTEQPMKSYYWYSDKDDKKVLSDDPSIEVTESGKYWVRAEVAAGECFLTDTIDVEFTIPEFSLGNDRIVCPGEMVTFDIEATNEGDQYLWQPGNKTSNSYSVTPDSDETIDISLTMTDTHGCSATDETTVTGRSAASIDWSIPGSDICMGDTLRTSTDMHQYEWSIDGTVVPDHNLPYLVPTNNGTYSLTVWTDEDCADSKSIDLTVNPKPAPDIPDVWDCPGNNGTITAPAGYNYSWEYGSGSTANGSSLTLNNPDSVHVTITDNSTGCRARDTVIFDWYNKNVFSFGEDTSVCVNNDITIEVDDDFLNYEWTFKENETAPTQILPTSNHIHTITTATNSNVGTYTVEAVDTYGCDVKGSFDLDVENVPDLDITQTEDICEGYSIKIETQNHEYIKFRWTLDSENVSDSSFVIVSTAGKYILTAEKANGCLNTASSTVAVWDSPKFNITDVTACPGPGTGIKLKMKKDSWETPQSGANAIPQDFELKKEGSDSSYTDNFEGNLMDPEEGAFHLTDPEAGTYYLTVSDGRCSRTRSVDVAYHELPEINLEDGEFCDNDTITLTIPSELIPFTSSYQWSREGTPAPPPGDCDVTEEGEYTLTITHNNGCKISGSLTLTHLPSPSFSLGTDRDKCLGDTIMITANPLFTRYEWNEDVADNQTNIIETTNAGKYSLEVWAENGCSTVGQIEVDVHPIPSVDVGPDIEGCAGLTETLSIEEGNYQEIDWYTDGRYKESGRFYTVGRGVHSVKVVDENGCKNSDQMTLTWNGIPSVELGPDLHICPVEYPLTIDAPEGFNRYEWHDGRTSRTITASLMDTINRVTVTDENNCTGFDTKVVSLLPPLPFSLSDTSACEPEELVLDAGTEIFQEYAGEKMITYIQSYRWSNSSTAQTDTVRESGEYWVEIFDGCHYIRDTATVEYHPAPQIARLDTTYYAQVTVFAENGTEPYSYALDNEDDRQFEKTFKNIENGEHTVFVEDQNGCTAVTVFYSDSQYDINIPGFFTPNNDGYNDVWIVEDIHRLPESTISIYDRYGKLLRKFVIGDSPGWDGTYLNKPVPSDDYWYVIHLKPVDKIIKGNVTVKR